MTDTPRTPFPVRDPAPGPAVVLDLPRLWRAVEAEARRRGMTHANGTVELKAIADATGIDRSTLGRIRGRADAGDIPTGQRAGININAAMTLVSFAHNGRAADFGREVRGGIAPYTEPFLADAQGEYVDEYCNSDRRADTPVTMPDEHGNEFDGDRRYRDGDDN